MSAVQATTACPPALTGGESFSLGGFDSPRSTLDSRTCIDWLTATFLPESIDHDPTDFRTPKHVAFASHVIAFLRYVLGDVVAEDCPGMLGYAHGCKIFAVLDGGKRVSLGRLDWGGAHHGGRSRLDLSGSGCSRINKRGWIYLRNWLSMQKDIKLTRCDLAADFYDGEYDIDTACDWLRAGLFNAGGRNPRHSTPGDWLSDKPYHGRTLEVGRRENGKMLRVYEKGLQLAPGSGSKWTRFEVEIRNKDREIPLDILTNPDKYFAGAYKCLEQMVTDQPERIKTEQREGTVSLEQAISHARTSYGPLIHVMRVRMDAAEILDAITRPGVPKRLERAAVAGCLPTRYRRAQISEVLAA